MKRPRSFIAGDSLCDWARAMPNAFCSLLPPNLHISRYFGGISPPISGSAVPTHRNYGKACPPETQQILPSSPIHCRFSFSGSMMKRMSLSETIFLFFLALIIFGPKKLPEIARQVGKYMNEFRRASNEFKAQIEQEISNLEVENRQTILPPSTAPEGATSRALYAPPGEVNAAEVPATDSRATGAPATLAASDDEPLFASGGGASATDAPAVATEAASPSNDVTSPASQESHV
jgi:sec-independent protein translocase protein TatB